MPRRITTFKSKNLLGETKSEEKRRLNRVVRKEVNKKGLAGIKSALDKSFLTGATKSQLRTRKQILKKAGLSKQKPRSIRERRRFL